MVNLIDFRGFVPLIILFFNLLKLIKKSDYESIQPSEEDLTKAIDQYENIIKRSIDRRLLFCILSFAGVTLELVLVGYQISCSFITTTHNFELYTLFAHGLMWILYFALGVSILPSAIAARDPKNYGELTDDSKSCYQTFQVEFSSFQLIVPFLIADFVYFTLSQTSQSWKIAVIQPILAIFILLYFKLSLTEARFLKRLLLLDNSSKEITASWFSQLTFSYADDLLAIGAEKTLDYEDLDSLIPEDKSKHLFKEFNRLKCQDHSLLRNIFRLVKKEFFQQQLATFVGSWAIIAGPILLKLTLDYLANPGSTPLYIPYIYAAFMFIATMIRSFSDGQTYFLGRRIGLRVKTVLITLIYTKSLCRIAESPGKISNLMSVDAQKILDVCCYLMYLWSTPLQTLICVLLLIYIAGIPGLAGVLVMLVSVPLAAKVMSRLQGLRKKLMNSTDKRINAVNEMLQGIRIVKFFAWENRFLEKIGILRETELDDLWSYVFSQAFYRIIWTATPVLVSFFTFLTFTMFSDRVLTISTAFTCLALFDQLRRPLLIIPDIVVNVLEAWVSFKRIRKYIESPELEEYINTEQSTGSDDTIIKFVKDSKFTWNTDPVDEVDGQHQSFTLFNVGITFPKGGLTIVYGTTGSGKSTLLSAILGELNRVHGSVFLYGGKGRKTDLPIAYASQQGKAAILILVWLQNATIKNNILFGNPYDPQRYNAVIKYCALKRDLQVLEAGDNLEVGEKGIFPSQFRSQFKWWPKSKNIPCQSSLQ